MKSVFASLLIFFCLLFLIIWNYFYVNRTAAEMEQQLRSLPSAAQALTAVEALEAFWEREHPFISLSVSMTEVRNMTTVLTELRHAAAVQEENDFERCRSLALVGVEQLRRLEQFTLGNLF